jgi:pimeloyl-ACP methyl ester carboxylesterase
MPSATINGYQHYWEDMGQGDAFVMFHGASSSGKLLIPHGQELAKTFRVIIPDMRGMGQSARMESIPPDAWVEDLRGLLDHLGIDSAHVYGTSLGSRVALRFGIAYPERTKTVILDNAIIAFEEAGNQAMNARLGDPDSMPPEEVERFQMLHGDDWKVAVRSYFAWRNDPAVHAYYDMRESSKGLKLPVLLCRGDAREHVHPMEHTFELFRNLENSRLWINPEGPALRTPAGYEKIRNFIAEPAKYPTVIRM